MPRLAKENNIDGLLTAMINRTKEIYEKDNLQCPEGHVDITRIINNNKYCDGTWGIDKFQDFKDCVPNEDQISGFYQCNDFAVFLCYGVADEVKWNDKFRLLAPVFFVLYEYENGDIRHITPNIGNTICPYTNQVLRFEPFTYYIPEKYIILKDGEEKGWKNPVSPLYIRWCKYMFDSADTEIMLADVMSRVKTRNGQTIKVGKNVKDRWKRIYEYDPPEDYIPRRRILC